MEVYDRVMTRVRGFGRGLLTSNNKNRRHELPIISSVEPEGASCDSGELSSNRIQANVVIGRKCIHSAPDCGFGRGVLASNSIRRQELLEGASCDFGEPSSSRIQANVVIGRKCNHSAPDCGFGRGLLASNSICRHELPEGASCDFGEPSSSRIQANVVIGRKCNHSAPDRGFGRGLLASNSIRRHELPEGASCDIGEPSSSRIQADGVIQRRVRFSPFIDVRHYHPSSDGKVDLRFEKVDENAVQHSDSYSANPVLDNVDEFGSLHDIDELAPIPDALLKNIKDINLKTLLIEMWNNANAENSTSEITDRKLILLTRKYLQWERNFIADFAAFHQHHRLKHLELDEEKEVFKKLDYRLRQSERRKEKALERVMRRHGVMWSKADEISKGLERRNK